MSEPYLRSSKSWSLWLAVGFLWAAGAAALLCDEHVELLSGINSFVVGFNCLLFADSVWFYAICASFRSPTKARARSSATLLALGLLALLFKSPAAQLGLDTEEFGWLLLILGSASAWFTVASADPNPDSPMTQMALGEKTALASLLTNSVIGAYLFTVLRDFHRYNDASEMRLGQFVTVVIAVLILESLALDGLRRLQGEGAVEDERDAVIAKQAASTAHTVLVTMLISAIIAMGTFPHSWSGWSSSVATAHALIGVLLLSSLIEHGTAIWLYRRDRQ